MGSISRQNRNESYIEEFALDAYKIYAPGPEAKKVFPDWSISVDESSDTVRLFWVSKLDGKEEAFTAASFPVFFDPDEMDEDLVERTMDVLQLERKVAIARLVKAGLIHPSMVNTVPESPFGSDLTPRSPGKKK
jgi:hypothetical protein